MKSLRFQGLFVTAAYPILSWLTQWEYEHIQEKEKAFIWKLTAVPDILILKYYYFLLLIHL